MMMKSYFGLNSHRSLSKEIIAGFTTFLAAMYIIVVNPSILRDAGMPFNAVLTATVLISAFSSIAMGFYARNPIVLAPGMGLNAFFTYSVVNIMGVAWETALGAVFISGVIFILLSIFNIRTYIVKAIPGQLRYAIAAGIGLLISFIGFVKSGFIIANPSTLVTFGGINTRTFVFAIGVLVTAVLVIKNIKGAIIYGIILTTLLVLPDGRFYGDEILVKWQGLWQAPDFSLVFKLDIIGALSIALWPVIFAFLFTDMFDSLSTFVGIAEAADLVDQDGEPLRIRESLIVDGFSTTISGLLGSSAGTCYIESAAGVKEGGRTGLTAIVAGCLFLPFMFFAPLLSIIPAVATAPALVVVGVFMMKPVTKINWVRFDDAIPAFIALILIPLTYSITQGIIWGFLSWSLIKTLTGKAKEVSPVLWIIDVFAVLALYLA